jgi:hypothetical protein
MKYFFHLSSVSACLFRRSILNYKIMLCMFVGCVSSTAANAQTSFRPSTELAASVDKLAIQPGLWEVRRSDVRDQKPYSKCMTQGDWETTKLRAMGKILTPPDCSVKDVSLHGKVLKTTYSCIGKIVVEEFEFSGNSFQNRAFETRIGGGKTATVLESSGKFFC